MNIEIIKNETNPCFGRKEIEFSVVEKVTPARTVIKDAVAKAAKGKPELTVITKVDQQTGSNLTKGTARIYESKEIMDKIELGYHAKRTKEPEAPKEETPAPTPAPKEESPAPAPEAPAPEAAAPEAPVEEPAAKSPAEAAPKEPAQEAPKEETPAPTPAPEAVAPEAPVEEPKAE